MKKITLIFSILLSTLSFAQNVKNVIIYSDNGENFTLLINNIQQHEFPENNVLVQGLISNAYGINIIFENNLVEPIKKTLYLPEESVEITYKVIEKKGKMKLRIVSQTTLPTFYETIPNRTVIVFGNTPVYSQTNTTITNTTINNAGVNDNISVGVNVGGINIGMNVNINDNSNIHYTESTTITTTTSSNNHFIMDGYNGPYGCPWPMNEMDFKEALHIIANKTWDDTRLSIAKQIVSANCLFADQVRDIVQLFEWEDKKLEFAKFSYQFTYDRGNYFKVSQAFEWEDNIEELNNFISNQ